MTTFQKMYCIILFDNIVYYVLTFDQIPGSGAQHQRLPVLASPRDLWLRVAGSVTRKGRIIAFHQRQVGARLVGDYVWWH